MVFSGPFRGAFALANKGEFDQLASRMNPGYPKVVHSVV
jgi:hypothetical protein